MKSFMQKRYDRLPLIIGAILNLILVCVLYYYSSTLIYSNFSLEYLIMNGVGSLKVESGISDQMAFSLFICFLVYTVSSILISFMAICKKEPLYLSFLCWINFILGAFKLVYDYFQLDQFNSDDKIIIYFLLISSFTFLLSNAIFDTTLRKHHKPKLSLIFDLLVFIPIFLPHIISMIQEKLLNQTENLIIPNSQASLNLLTTIAWIAFPNLILLYFAQYSASKGYKEESSYRHFEKVASVNEIEEPVPVKEEKTKVTSVAQPVQSNPEAIQEFIKDESSVTTQKNTPNNPSLQLGSKDESLAMFSKSKILFTTTEININDIKDEISEEKAPEDHKDE